MSEKYKRRTRPVRASETPEILDALEALLEDMGIVPSRPHAVVGERFRNFIVHHYAVSCTGERELGTKRNHYASDDEINPAWTRGVDQNLQ